MNCTKTRHNIVSGEISPEAAMHLKACASCLELFEKVNQTMSLLDQEVNVPETLSVSVLSRIQNTAPRRTRSLGLITLIQVAAVVSFGIFIGHQFGRHAGPIQKTTGEDPVNLYFKAHHLNVDHSGFASTSTFIPNNHD
jgi:hypothetical protein